MCIRDRFYAQAVCGLSPTRAALLTAPMAIASGVLAPVVGRLVDRVHPRPIVGFGFSALAIALTWLSFEMTTTTPIWRLVLPLTLMGIGMAFIWSPLAATATRHLPHTLAGAGSGVYNTTRQVGSVLGSAGMAALMTSQISSALPPELDPGAGQGAVARLPAFLHGPFSDALSQSLLLPAAVALCGVIAALFLRGSGDGPGSGPGRLVDASTYVEPDYFRDDDDYVEYAVEWSSDEEAEWQAEPDEPVYAAPRHVDVIAADESVTTPFAAHVEHPLHAPAETWHGGPFESWHGLLDDDPDTVPERIAFAEPTSIRFAHNGFHVEAEENLRVPPPPPTGGGRHSRDESRTDDDAGTYGRHSMRFRD